MAAASFDDDLSSELSDFLERFDEALENLPLELREMIDEDPEKASDFDELREKIYKYSLEEYFEENPNMEEVSYSPYFMQKFDETIQKLSPEVCKKIYKDYLSMMQKERAALGWEEVHEALLKKPFSDLLEQIVPDRFCVECGYGCFVGSPPFCYLCEVTEREIAFSLMEE